MGDVEKNAKIEELKKYALIVYILYALGFIIGITPIAGVIVAYLKKNDAVGTWIESHFEYQIRTFWISLIGLVVGIILSFTIILSILSIVIVLADIVWFLYRTIKGWLMLNDRKEINPYAWF